MPSLKQSSLAAIFVLPGVTTSAHSADMAMDEDIAMQRDALAEVTMGTDFGPQSPRDLDTPEGNNFGMFDTAPAYTEMNLCDIHFHESAEHKGGEFTTFAGNGDGKGKGTGFVYDGELTKAEVAPYGKIVGEGKYGSLEPGDTIELHYVHSTFVSEPAPGLGSCLPAPVDVMPQLRVETQVYVLVNDKSALDFMELTRIEHVDGRHQAVNIPSNTGNPIQYAGSTTGPGFNRKASPLNVSWSVRPMIAKVHIGSVDIWLQHNPFNENAAHGVRNLVINPDLLSPI